MKKIFTIFGVLIAFFTIILYAQKKEVDLEVKPEAKLIAIASTGDSLNSQIDRQFGRAANFILYNLKTDTFLIINNKYANSSSGAGTQTAWEIADRKVEAVIGQNFGPKSLDVLMSANIKVFRNVTGTVKDAVENYKKGKLEQAKY